MSDIAAQLKALKLHGMAAGYGDLVEQGGSASLQISEWLIKHLI